jgi:acyl carrier protein
MGMTVADRVKKVVKEVLKVDEAKIVSAAHFVRDLGAESIQAIELVAAFEEEFDIEMDQDEALAVDTVGGAIAYITKVMKEQGKA